MTRAASQAGDAESSRAPFLNSSIQTSMNNHGIRYNLCHNKSASVIPYFILAVKSRQERLDLNETQRRYFKYELQFKMYCMDCQSGSISANNGYIAKCAYELYIIDKPSRSWHN